MVMLANIHALNFRSLQAPLAQIGWLTNPWILAAVLGMIGLQVAAVYTPFLQHALNTAPLSLQDWGVIACSALPLFIGSEIYKTIHYKKKSEVEQ